MRQPFFVLIVLISALFIHGCKNNNVDVKRSLIGNWELRKTISVLNKTSKFVSSGNGNILVFTSTNYKQFSNGSMISMGRYKIIEDTVKSIGTISSGIVFKPEIYAWDTTKYFIRFEKNQLIIAVDTVGALTRFYERLN